MSMATIVTSDCRESVIMTSIIERFAIAHAIINSQSAVHLGRAVLFLVVFSS